ncbi:TIGR00725 family protein [Ornithinimicrobium avium]|uniref:TIGR00725 family protein n=1 Tax=Ornithinimicrobium avium TaxID=2283195 RepID=A0A345NSC0_9MICO|nr:TIGR00725 family protein [Ornithinimicrobium avium]
MGVVGAGEGATAEQEEPARQVARLLALSGAVVVTGGLGGVMAAAAGGCAEAGGTSLALLPGTDRAQAGAPHTLVVPTGLGELRNGLLVRSSDALVAVGPSWGTLSEVALAVRTGVPVVLLGWGALADHLPTDPGLSAPRRAGTPEEAADLVRALLDAQTPRG